jgi:hypothetical protein
LSHLRVAQTQRGKVKVRAAFGSQGAVTRSLATIACKKENKKQLKNRNFSKFSHWKRGAAIMIAYPLNSEKLNDQERKYRFMRGYIRSTRPASRIRQFWLSEDGSYSIEAVIWMPIFAILMAFIMNLSMIFHNESQMLRVVQDANRAFSLGRLDDNAEVENYIRTGLSYLSPSLEISSVVSGGVISTTVLAPAVDLMPVSLMKSAFKNTKISVFSQHIIEF